MSTDEQRAHPANAGPRTIAQPEVQTSATGPQPTLAPPGFILRRPTVPPQFYVSIGRWDTNVLKAHAFGTLNEAKKIAHRLNLSGISIKLAMSQADVDAQQAVFDASVETAKAVVLARKAAKLARKEARAKGGNSPQAAPGSSGLPAMHR